jgi:hypothetical protein
MNLALLLPIAVFLVLVVLAAAVRARPRPSRHLAYRLGPEYGERTPAQRRRRGRFRH